MAKVVNYLILDGRDGSSGYGNVDVLATKVLHQISLGWQPIGGVTAVNSLNGTSNFLQAMIKVQSG